MNKNRDSDRKATKYVKLLSNVHDFARENGSEKEREDASK